MQTELDLSKQDNISLSEAIHGIEQIFLLVIVGEFNSGKSQFINTLLNEKELCPTEIQPTTDRINILRYGEKREKVAEDNTIDAFYIKNDLLKNTTLVDTPGTNSTTSAHQQITGK
jgi:GTP-binding protein EngB required for normal cell division